MSFRGSSQFPSMPQYNKGKHTNFSNPTHGSNDGSLLSSFELFSNKVEDFVDDYSGPIKPFVPAIGRFLIVATFYEDSLRIISQWSDQVFYLWNYKHIPYVIVLVFLFLNIIAMLAGSTALILRKKNEYAIGALIFVVVTQGIFYGLIFDKNFIFRSLSVVGGLILALSDSLVRDKRQLAMPGLPMINNKDNKKYYLLAGRVLLVILFIGFSISSSYSFTKIFIILIGFISCGSIIVGYKAKFAAVVLVFLLSTYNIIVNHYWSFGYNDSQRDYLKYEYFQTLSIVGGLLIIANAGAGELSLDEKKKVY